MSAQDPGFTSSQNYWPRAAEPALKLSRLDRDLDCDVAIIGAGILGLNSALSLASRGVSVVVLEAQEPGAGASGRNGGLVVPSLPRVGPDDVVRSLGETYGPRLVRLVADGAQTVFDLITERGLRCDATQSGWINPAHAMGLVDGLQARVRAWQRAGSRAQWLDGEQARERIGSATFHGALYDRSGGHLNPFAYTQELARVAMQAGVQIYGQAAVVRVVRQANRYGLDTATARVNARVVIQCTNAMQAAGHALERSVAKSFVPLSVFQLATQVVPESVRASLLPNNEALSDTRNNLFALRYTAEGRIVTGGMAALTQWLAKPRLLRALARRLLRIFPQLEALHFDYIWSGQAALTPDFLPRLFEPAPDWFAPLGCNGRGIAMSTSLGQRLGRYIVDRDVSVLPIPVSTTAPIRAHALASYLPQWLLPVGMLQDAIRR